MTETKPKSSQRKARNRRIVMLLVGAGLGLLCRALPPQYQAPCAVAAKIVGWMMGAS